MNTYAKTGGGGPPPTRHPPNFPEQQEQFVGAEPGVFERVLAHMIPPGPVWPHKYSGVEWV